MSQKSVTEHFDNGRKVVISVGDVYERTGGYGGGAERFEIVRIDGAMVTYRKVGSIAEYCDHSSLLAILLIRTDHWAGARWEKVA